MGAKCMLKNKRVKFYEQTITTTTTIIDVIKIYKNTIKYIIMKFRSLCGKVYKLYSYANINHSTLCTKLSCLR